MKVETPEKEMTNQMPTDLLYRVAKAMATVRDGRELLKIIVENAQPVFGFYDIGLTIFDKSRDVYVDWSVFYADISPSEANFEQRGLEYFTFPANEPLMVYAIERFAAEGKPFIEYLDAKFIERFPDFVHLELEIKHGYKQFLVTTLQFGGETLGVLNFNSKVENQFDNCDFELFQAIADLVAVAVANILANEEILAREREREKLLSISREIAKVQNRQQLLHVIFTTVRDILPYDDAGLFYFCDADGKPNPHGESYVHLLDDLISEVNTEIAASGITGVLSERIDSLRFFAQDEPCTTTLDELIERFPGHPFFPIMQRDGIRQFITKGIKVGGATIGMLSFNSRQENFYTKADFPLFDNIADQISVAVANILANEEILEREREKAILLSISRVIVTVRSKQDLLKLIIEKIKPVFKFYDCGVFIFDLEKKNLEDLTVSFPSISPSDANERLSQNGAAVFKFQGSVWEPVFESMRAAGKPIIFDYQNDELTGWSEYAQAEVLDKVGYQESLMTVLRTGGEEFGVFAVNSLEKGVFRESQFSLFQNIADQMAVAVSNILANDEVENQLAEIKELKKRLEAENIYLNEEIGKNYNYKEIIGTSPKLHQVFEIIEQVAPTDATVLIQGETGTGKELIARAIHNRSTRDKRPLIKINCAALPRELVESELFGHERGSFTGATEKRIGKFELSSGGTIFLDEIGELPLEMQIKLLRVLQEREIERLGGKGVIKLDLRVVAATNRNLAQEVQAGRFRADLYYRLCTVELFMPNLRERREDIEPLTMYFAEKYAAKFSRRITRISSKMLTELHAYDFPGNIRELEHIVEHAVIFSKYEKLILPRSLTTVTVKTEKNSKPLDKKEAVAESQSLQTIEREHILSVLRQTSGRIKGKNGTAEILGLNPATVYFRMKKLGIEKDLI